MNVATALPARFRWTEAGLLFCAVVWGVNIPVVKLALVVMPPFALNVFRFAFSAAALGAVYFARRRSDEVPFRDTLRSYGLQIAALGVLGYILYQTCFILGVDRTLAGNAALIMASSPLWTAAIGHLLGYEQVRRSAWMGLALSLLGTGVVVVGGGEHVGIAGSTTMGNLLMLAAAALWGAYTAFSRPVLNRLSPSALSFLGLLVALPVLAGLGVPQMDQVDWPRVDLWVWLAIVFSGGLSTGITILIWNVGVKKVGGSQTAVYGNLVPFVAVLTSALWLGEPVGLVQIVGGTLIIGGLVLTRRAGRP